MLISICIPCYNSTKTLPLVVDDIVNAFKDREEDYEIVLVNDGSPDGTTYDVIEELCKKNKKIIGVDLMRNYGQASAKIEAIRHASGDVVVLMDDDGQHKAKDIFKLTEKLIEGKYDVVYAHLLNRKFKKSRNLSSFIYNKVALAVGIKQKGVHTSSFAAYSKDVATKIRDYRSPFVSFGGYLRHLTTKCADVDIEHNERLIGESGYTFKKRMKMFKNIFFSFTMVPLQISTAVGTICSFGGFIGIIVLIIRKIIHHVPAGYTSTNVIILLIGGILMIMIGIVGEYLGRIYMTVSGMPQSTVRTSTDEKEK